MRVVIITIKKVKVYDIDTYSLFQLAVFISGFKLFTVKLCPVEQSTFFECRLTVHLHFYVYYFSVDIHFYIKPAELLVEIFGCKLNIIDIYCLDILTRYFKKVGYECRYYLFIFCISENTLEYNIKLQHNYSFFLVHRYRPPFFILL